MDKNNKNIDQFFREQLQGAREAPPASVWQGLEGKLKGKPPKYWVSAKGLISSLAVVIVTVGSIVYFGSGSSAPDQHQPAHVAVVANEPVQQEQDEAALHHTAEPVIAAESKAEPAAPVQQQDRQQENNIGTAVYGADRNDIAHKESLSVPESADRHEAKHKTATETLVAHKEILAGKKALTTGKGPKADGDKPLAVKSVKPEQVPHKPKVQRTASRKTLKDQPTVAVSELNQDKIIADNPVPTSVPEAQWPADKSSEAVVVHKVQFKGPADTSGAEADKYVPEPDIAANYTVRNTQPAAATATNASGSTASTKGKPEVITRGKVARLSETKTQGHIAIKLPPAAKLPVAEEQRIKKSLNLFLGIKAGYETGFSSFTSGKYVGSLFGEVQVTDRWSFLLQPSIKLAQLNRTLFTTGNYFQAGATSSSLFNVNGDSVIGYTYDYAYRQSYDSMITSIELKKRFTELELPLFFRYKINRQFSAMAGVNITFGKIALWENKVQTMNGLTMTDTVLNYVNPVAPAASEKFLHGGSTPFTNYTPLALPSNTSPVRFGYGLGLTYTFREKLMFDLLMQQNLSGYKGIGQTDVQNLYSQAYLRLSVGYKLFSSRKK